MSKYFYDNGYFKGSSVFDDPQPFVFVLGGRGTGKTYSITKWACDNCDEDHKFIFMRRTQAEMDFINTGNIYAEHSPEIELNTKKQKIPQVIRTAETGDDVIGYHIALSTIHNIRGFAMQDVSYIIFDEFIAERGTVCRQFSGEQMLNAYETINRNRELNGKDPVKCVFLSNYNTTESDIMQSFGFTDELYTYGRSHPIGVYKDNLKELIMINDSPISDRKSQTALYKVQADRNFEKMSLQNNGVVHLMPIKHYGRNAYEYVRTAGNVNINHLYSGCFYVTESQRQAEITRKDLINLQRYYHAYLLGNMFASSDYAAQCFVDIFK